MCLLAAKMHQVFKVLKLQNKTYFLNFLKNADLIKLQVVKNLLGKAYNLKYKHLEPLKLFTSNFLQEVIMSNCID